ncbi:MAG: hypothetical protein WBN89_01265, partial [Prochlorococcaceae cyanobacterium]
MAKATFVSKQLCSASVVTAALSKTGHRAFDTYFQPTALSAAAGPAGLPAASPAAPAQPAQPPP